MLAFISTLFGSVLVNILQLAAGCVFIVAANRMKAKGYAFRVDSRSKRLFAVVSTSLAGVLLPLGPFGALPVAAAAWMAGLELPLALPLLVSNFLFNLSLPLTQAAFAWNGCEVRIAMAAAAGALSGLALLRSGNKAWSLLRRSTCIHLFEGQTGESNYLRVLKSYFETAGLFVFAAAVADAAFSMYIKDWLYTGILSAGFGMSVADGLSGLNILNPYFLPTLARLIDFSALAAMLLLLKGKSLAKLYLYYIVILLPLAATLWIR